MQGCPPPAFSFKPGAKQHGSVTCTGLSADNFFESILGVVEVLGRTLLPLLLWEHSGELCSVEVGSSLIHLFPADGVHLCFTPV